MRRFFLGALIVALMACDDQPGACPSIKCTDSLTMPFTTPLSAPGDYVLSVSGSVAGRCAVSLPDLDVSCDNPSIHIQAVDGSNITGMKFDLAPASVTLSITRDGVELLTVTSDPPYETVLPGCGSCRSGTVSVFTDDVANGENDGGLERDAGSEPDAAISCDRFTWDGTYQASYQPVETTCPEWGTRDFLLVDGLEEVSYCTIADLTWSADGCTRTTTMNCTGEGTSYTWELRLSQVTPDGSELIGIGHLQFTVGLDLCEGDYNVTYTRYPGT